MFPSSLPKSLLFLLRRCLLLRLLLGLRDLLLQYTCRAPRPFTRVSTSVPSPLVFPETIPQTRPHSTSSESPSPLPPRPPAVRPQRLAGPSSPPARPQWCGGWGWSTVGLRAGVGEGGWTPQPEKGKAASTQGGAWAGGFYTSLSRSGEYLKSLKGSQRLCAHSRRADSPQRLPRLPAKPGTPHPGGLRPMQTPAPLSPHPRGISACGAPKPLLAAADQTPSLRPGP